VAPALRGTAPTRWVADPCQLRSQRCIRREHRSAIGSHDTRNMARRRLRSKIGPNAVSSPPSEAHSHSRGGTRRAWTFGGGHPRGSNARAPIAHAVQSMLPRSSSRRAGMADSSPAAERRPARRSTSWRTRRLAGALLQRSPAFGRAFSHPFPRRPASSSIRGRQAPTHTRFDGQVSGPVARGGTVYAADVAFAPRGCA
jgi:hypothetical protein